MKSIHKFTGKAEGYSKYRPGYPDEYIDYLISANALTPTCAVADIGSGTGILSGQLLERGLSVLAVEPNADMRAIAEQRLGIFPQFKSIDGTAENTTLETGSVDLVTVAQAFHWFHGDRFQTECHRILKPGARVALAWNSRDIKSPVVRETERICKACCPEFVGFNGGIERDPGVFRRFFMHGVFEFKEFRNDATYDLEGFLGRNLSGSYAPGEDDARYAPFLAELTALFHEHCVDGKLIVPTSTRSYLGFV